MFSNCKQRPAVVLNFQLTVPFCCLDKKSKEKTEDKKTKDKDKKKENEDEDESDKKKSDDKKDKKKKDKKGKVSILMFLLVCNRLPFEGKSS